VNQEVTTVFEQVEQLRAYVTACTAPLFRRVGGERGQTAAEYIGVIALIAAVVAVLITQGKTVSATIIDGVTKMIKKVVSDGGA
jgi:Flp pilus assembly pilin Flp